MHQMGYMYFNGVEVVQDKLQAVHWFQRAAKMGHKEAMFDIAHHYRNGSGIDKDKLKALDWMQKSADLGYPQAKKALRKFRRI